MGGASGAGSQFGRFFRRGGSGSNVANTATTPSPGGTAVSSPGSSSSINVTTLPSSSSTSDLSLIPPQVVGVPSTAAAAPPSDRALAQQQFAQAHQAQALWAHAQAQAGRPSYASSSGGYGSAVRGGGRSRAGSLTQPAQQYHGSSPLATPSASPTTAHRAATPALATGAGGDGEDAGKAGGGAGASWSQVVGGAAETEGGDASEADAAKAE